MIFFSEMKKSENFSSPRETSIYAGSRGFFPLYLYYVFNCSQKSFELVLNLTVIINKKSLCTMKRMLLILTVVIDKTKAPLL